MGYGWKGKKVRHNDGRTGVIEREDEWFAGDDLHIAVDGGGRAIVQLHARNQDSGEAGWNWLCENFSGGPRWLPLGDHNKPNVLAQGRPSEAREPDGVAGRASPGAAGWGSAAATEK